MFNYICRYDNKFQRHEWSGTTTSLLNSLKKLIEVNEIPFIHNRFTEKFLQIFNARFIDGKIHIHNGFHKSTIMYDQRLLDRILRNFGSNDINFQIGALGYAPNSCYYIDLSWSSVIKYKQICPVNKYMNFDYVPIELIKEKNAFEIKHFDKAKYIFTMSKWLKDFLIENDKIDENKVIHVGGGFNLDTTFKLHDKSNDKILFVGRDFERKGGFLLLEAFKIIKDKFKLPLKLYIAGCERKETIEDVFWLGDLPVSKLKHYFEISDIFVLPSYFEAYGLVFIEALTYGLPCIARNDFEMKNFIQDGYNGYLIDNDDPSLLADKILDLIENDRIKQNVCKERNKYLEEYSWDSVAKRIINVLGKEFDLGL